MAYSYIKKTYLESEINCLIFHDIDLIPESDYNLYECDDVDYAPRHLSLMIRKENFENSVYEKSPYELLIGGVLAIKPSIFEKINGFSNQYWNWGAEDDGLNSINFFF